MEPIRTRRAAAQLARKIDESKDSTTTKTRKSYGKENQNNGNADIKENQLAEDRYLKLDVVDKYKSGKKEDNKSKLRSGRSILTDKSNLISQPQRATKNADEQVPETLGDSIETQLRSNRKDRKNTESKPKTNQNLKSTKGRKRSWQSTVEVYNDNDEEDNFDDHDKGVNSDAIEDEESLVDKKATDERKHKTKKNKVEHEEDVRKNRGRKTEKTEQSLVEVKNNKMDIKSASSDPYNPLTSTSEDLLEEFNASTIEDRVITVTSTGKSITEPYKNLEKQMVQKLQHQNIQCIRPQINIKINNLPADKADRNDPLAVTDYIDDMFLHWHNVPSEVCKYLSASRYAEFSPKMRAILVDWLVDVHIRFKLVPNTLYLCVQLIDRYCSYVTVLRSRIQLVGITCLMIAGKFEDVYPPDVGDCVYITDSAYAEGEVLEMETDILNTLDYRIHKPTIYNFLTRIIKLIKLTKLGRWRAHYYAERCLQEHDMLDYTECQVACAAVAYAKMSESLDVWPKEMKTYTKLSFDELKEPIRMIAKFVPEISVTGSNRQLTAVKKKYANAKYMEVSEVGHPQFPMREFDPELLFDD